MTSKCTFLLLTESCDLYTVASGQHHTTPVSVDICLHALCYVHAAAASLLTTLMHTDCSINDRMHQPTAPQITDDAATLKSHL